MKRVAMCILGVLFLSGCSQRVADLTVASTKNYNMNGGQFVTGNRVTGEDSSAIVIFLSVCQMLRKQRTRLLRKIVALWD